MFLLAFQFVLFPSTGYLKMRAAQVRFLMHRPGGGWSWCRAGTYVIALDELTAEEAADLGPLLRALTAAMRAVLGCSKTYAALFAEAEGFEHVHIYVVPRSPDLDRDCAAHVCSGTWAVIPPVMCLPR